MLLRLPYIPTRGHNHAHAVRVLARAWLRIIWRCCRDGLACNPDRHHAALLARTPPAPQPGPTAPALAS